MTLEEIDAARIKAMLSFDEEEAVSRIEPPYELWKYQNSLGQYVTCRILVRRSSGEIVVQNINGTRVCLTETQIHKI